MHITGLNLRGFVYTYTFLTRNIIRVICVLISEVCLYVPTYVHNYFGVYLPSLKSDRGFMILSVRL